MRPGKSASSVPNCSAITSGAWLGSMMPPAPTRIVDVPAGDVRDHDRGRGARDARHAVVLGEPEAPVAPALGVLRQVERVAQRARRVAVGGDRREIEDGHGDHRAMV